MPDVGINLALDELELIELPDDFAAILYHDVSRFLEGGRVAEAQDGSAVARNELVRRMRHAPSLSQVSKLLQNLQREAVVYETDMRFPGPLVDVPAPVNDALAEVLRRQIVALQNPSGFWSDGQHRGAPLDSNAFVEYSVQIKEAF